MLKNAKYASKFLPVIFLLFNNLFAIQTEEKPGSQPTKNQEVTQIAAHLSIPWIKNKVEKSYRIKGFKPLVGAMMKNARVNMKTHYDFYHAQAPGFRIFQDFYKKCFEFFMITAQIKHFTFLRMRDPIFDKYSDISEFLKDELRQRGLIDDNLNETKCYVLSVNLSPFGNVGTLGEATFDYFKQGFSHANPESFLKKVFDTFGLDTKFIADLKKIDDLIYTNEGSLFQIFVPKKDVDKVAYLSWRHGVPFDEKIIDSLLGGIFASNDFVSKQLENIREIHAKPESKSFAVEIEMKTLFKKINDGTYYISKILDTYRSTPEKLKYLNDIQARLLLSNDMLLNPKSGVKILRYTTVPKEKMIEYQKKLDEISNLIFIDWIEKNLDKKDTKIMPEEMIRVRILLKFMQEGKVKTGQVLDPAAIDAHIRMLQELKGKVPEVAPIEPKPFEPKIKIDKLQELPAQVQQEVKKHLDSAERQLQRKDIKSARIPFNKAVKLLKDNKVLTDEIMKTKGIGQYLELNLQNATENLQKVKDFIEKK